MKTCTNCILPETYPGITFNEHGVCNYCLEYEVKDDWLGKEALLELLKTQNKTASFDCVVPISGGKDSCYILYYVVRELGLNPIAVFYNSGYQTEIAEQNVYNACNTLNVHLEEIQSPGKIQTNLLKSSYDFSQQSGRDWDVCLNCPQILRIVPYNIAKKINIKFIIWGGSMVESVKNMRVTEKTITRNPKVSILRKFKTLFRIMKRFVSQPSIILPTIRYSFNRMIQRIALKFPFRFVLNPFKGVSIEDQDIKFINFFEYIQWDSMENVELLERELGWRHPPGKDSRFDCQLHTVTNMKYLQLYGITHDGVSLCNLVREGRMTKEEALERERKISEFLVPEYVSLIKGL